MALIVPHLLFAVERYDRASRSIRIIGGVIIALEDPMYVGRLLVGGDTVEDRSDLVMPGGATERLIDELQKIGDQPGTRVTREHQEVFTLFDNPTMTERRDKVTFIRHGNHTRFLRKTDRYDRILREFVAEQDGRQRK
jgi:hypothetical protein